jgi:hypothetical protein
MALDPRPATPDTQPTRPPSPAGAPSPAPVRARSRRTLHGAVPLAARPRAPARFKAPGRRCHDLVPQSFVGADRASQKDSVWAQYTRKCGPTWTVISGLITLASAVTGGLLSWPFWGAAALVTLIVACVAATLTDSRALVAGITLATGALLATLGVLITSSPSKDAPLRNPTHPPAASAPTILTRTEWGRPVASLLAAGNNVWGVSGARRLVEFDGSSLVQLGSELVLPSKIEHIAFCAGELLVTFGDGFLGESADAGEPRLRAIRYGNPVPAGNETGMVACAGHSAYVAMSREALLLRFSVPGLKLIATIPRSAQRITGLAVSNSVVYVEDRTQGAVYTVRGGVPWRYKKTMPFPAMILPGSGEAVLSHASSRCLGAVSEAFSKEVGLPWAAHAAVRLLTAGPTGGAAVDSEGYLYRFGPTGGLVGAPVRVTAAQYASSAALTTGGELVLAIPSGEQLLRVPSGIWVSHSAASLPDAECLAPPAAQASG